MNNNKIGAFIVSLRKEQGLTQQALAEKLFVTDKDIKDIYEMEVTGFNTNDEELKQKVNIKDYETTQDLLDLY